MDARTTIKLAVCNFQDDPLEIRRLALENGFSGVDWTFKLDELPEDPAGESEIIGKIAALHPLEVRYHCAFKEVDLGDEDATEARAAMALFRRICRLVHRMDGRFVTIHLGLGREAMNGLSWDRTTKALSELVSFARGLGIRICLENLASGWSSRPELFEKLIRRSGAGVTLDIGHAAVSHSVETQHYAVEDFVLPHQEKVFNAHIYHEERDDVHLPPSRLEDVKERLNLLRSLSCDWWVLELREPAALFQTLSIVNEYFQSNDRLTGS
ncbi:MAG TPA: TIM barrel protein [Syntrophobacter fumaroxidans]|nr:TIM barrel protein [Syntrophobacter fumaroxidans]